MKIPTGPLRIEKRYNFVGLPNYAIKGPSGEFRHPPFDLKWASGALRENKKKNSR